MKFETELKIFFLAIMILMIIIIFFVGFSLYNYYISHSEITIIVDGIITDMKIEGIGNWTKYIIEINGKDYIIADIISTSNPMDVYYKLNIGDHIRIYSNGIYEIY